MQIPPWLVRMARTFNVNKPPGNKSSLVISSVSLPRPDSQIQDLLVEHDALPHSPTSTPSIFSSVARGEGVETVSLLIWLMTAPQCAHAGKSPTFRPASQPRPSTHYYCLFWQRPDGT